MDLSLINIIETLNVDAVQESITSLKDKGTDLERIKSSIERVLRTKALEFGRSDIPIVDVEAFVKFVIGLAEKDIGVSKENDKDNKICTKTLTIQILQDIFDVSTTQRCEQLFGIIENNIHIWKTPFFFSSCKNMILRLCNDLLKRLSRFIDTTFCGRILILLAKSLPLNEKSGLNLPGHFNTQNVTVFDREKKDQHPQHEENEQRMEEGPEEPPQLPSVSSTAGGVDDDMEVGEIRDHRDSFGGTIPMDYNLYFNFWDLQRFFSNPNLLFENDNFTKLENDISNVFALFSAYKIEKPQRQECNGDVSPQHGKAYNNFNYKHENSMEIDYDCDTKNDVKIINLDDKNSDNSFKNNSNIGQRLNVDLSERTFCAKYLTSEKLFPFQMSDSQFRRYFLLQFLIISNYLASRTRPKEALELNSTQEETLQGLMDKCYNLLRETYPNGSRFASSVKKLLLREKQWCSWKADGFPDLFNNTNIQSSSSSDDIKFERKQISTRYVANSIDLGNSELTRLWTIEKDNLTACKNVKRNCIPNLKSFLEEALDELDPEQQVEEKYQSVNDEHYQWMASRFLLMNSDQHINHASQDANMKMFEKPSEKDAIAVFLRRSIQVAAENVPELKSRAQQIQASIEKIKKRENDRLEEQARVAKELEIAKAKELELAKVREMELRLKEEKIKIQEKEQQQQRSLPEDLSTRSISKSNNNSKEGERRGGGGGKDKTTTTKNELEQQRRGREEERRRKRRGGNEVSSGGRGSEGGGRGKEDEAKKRRSEEKRRSNIESSKV
uniref:Uncharacterized protein n=1 Tax=Meloidogyne enterolobii TaxID=390850 RepID=A0A6V7UI99_MELEN|nr:unnamed protein product [Meloidogyne enterolobii]